MSQSQAEPNKAVAYELDGKTPNLFASPEPQWFDYASLDPNVAADARAAIDRIKTRLHYSICETGRDLIRIKDQMNHGQFGNWISCELGISFRTAQNYMAAARLVEGRSESVSLLPPSVLYVLAARSAPPDLVEEILAAVDAGTSVSVDEIRQKLNPSAGARRKRQGLSSVEQLQRTLDHDKRRWSANAARQQKNQAEQEAAETMRDAKAASVAQFLIARLSANDVAELLSLFDDETEWERVERYLYRFDKHQPSADAVETCFGSE